MSNPVPESAQRYTSRPVTITAVQWDGTEEHARQLCDWADFYRGRGSACYIAGDKPVEMGWTDASGAPVMLERPAHIVIGTLEGKMKLEKDAWLIQGTEDEFYPCKDSVFQRKYAREQTSRLTNPQIPAEMRASIDEHFENVRLVQRSLSITTVHTGSDFLTDGEWPKYVVSSDVEVYGDRRG